MATYHVARTNSDASPARFEWLESVPTFDTATDEVSGIRWTSDAARAHDFGAISAAEWSELISGAGVSRRGDAQPEEATDYSAKESERATWARKAYGEKLRESDRAAEAVAAPEPPK